MSVKESGVLSVLPLRGLVVFPHQVVPIIVGRLGSIAAIMSARQHKSPLVVVCQREGEESLENDELYSIGTVVELVQSVKLPNGTFRVVVKGIRRVHIVSLEEDESLLMGRCAPHDFEAPDDESRASWASFREDFGQLIRRRREIPKEMEQFIETVQSPDVFIFTVAPSLGLDPLEAQELLEETNREAAFTIVRKAIDQETEFADLSSKLRGQTVSSDADGDHSWLDADFSHMRPKNDADVFEEKVKTLKLPDLVRARVTREISRLRGMGTMSTEAGAVRSYLDWLVDLPWNAYCEDQVDIERSAEILGEAHFGLDELKERILEYLSVLRLSPEFRGPVLCLVGPPGVGKTSLAKSMAKAMGRPFVRVALGGIRDEAEIRGHRRTYVGALPGKLIVAMKRAKVLNPVILLDEVDKMSADLRGDPTAALLEVLDPEQNEAFLDHYLDVDFDLSRVTFICTANQLRGIPAPLQDRLEVIQVAGYTEHEKRNIAGTYQIPRQISEHGLGDEQLVVAPEALLRIIREYTKESGVRELERQIAKVCRRVARRIVQFGEQDKITLGAADVEAYLGTPRFTGDTIEDADEIGLVRGLAVSPWGGELLKIEVAVVPGKGKLLLTGQLGDWLKESAQAGLTYLRSRAGEFGLESSRFEQVDIHVHYPGNSLKTDGPSAGAAMATAMLSALLGGPISREVAMTGEVSLRGRVLKIGGLKEKLLAAHRGGCRRVFIPEENVGDLRDVADEILDALEVIPVRHMDDILRRVLPGIYLDGGDQ